MTFDLKRQITQDLRTLGVKDGGILLVHSSLRSLGPLPGTQNRAERAELVIRALLDTLGPQGTLLLPALSYKTVGEHNPVFDARQTPACIGALPEYFRTRPGTLRSIHPTHSVCGVGPRAEEMLAGHQLDHTPCGEHSPFARLPKVGGQVLFLGCGMGPNTSMHAIEEWVEPPYLFGDPVDYRVFLPDGTQTQMRVRHHSFAGCLQRYERLEGVMTGGLRKGRVLQAECHLLDAEAMWQAALEQYRKDPLYFVESTD